MSVPKINTVLYANASFCLASAVLIMLLPGMLADLVISLPLVVFRILGIGLLLFALDVLITARKESPSRGKVIYIFVADLAWVLMTPVVLFTLQERITNLGNLLLVDIAIVVGAFATFEWLAMGRMESSSASN